jgi:predicted LPLAT superfamily acyltransferase
LGKSPENCAPYAQIFAAALERFCRENPYQFFNFYDVWEQ